LVFGHTKVSSQQQGYLAGGAALSTHYLLQGDRRAIYLVGKFVLCDTCFPAALLQPTTEGYVNGTTHRRWRPLATCNSRVHLNTTILWCISLPYSVSLLYSSLSTVPPIQC